MQYSRSIPTTNIWFIEIPTIVFSAFLHLPTMLIDRFKQNLKEQFHLEPESVRLILAVSGGIDSCVLTDLVARTGIDFIIAHCNFQLRGIESERDEKFVYSLGNTYNKEVLVKKFDTKRLSSERKISVQEAARILRYEWFMQLMEEQARIEHHQAGKKSSAEQDVPSIAPKAVWLATAHNANDNIETLLINFFRGTGIMGLHGMPATQGKIIRPLLFAKREEITVYAKERHLHWEEDSSNLLDKYTRNFFRLNIIPMLKEKYPNVEDNLLHNIGRFGDAQILYQQAVQAHLKKICFQKGDEIHIPILKLAKTEAFPTITWEIIKSYHFHAAQVEETIKLFQATNGSYISSSTHRIIKNRNWLIIAPLNQEISEHILIEKDDRKVKFADGELIIEPLPAPPSEVQADKDTATLDAKKITYPLFLRKWKKGDYFYPFGMRKKKKLGKFLTDLKLSPTDKEKVWVIESDKRILWVIGLRIDNRFRITTSTVNALRIIVKLKKAPQAKER